MCECTGKEWTHNEEERSLDLVVPFFERTHTFLERILLNCFTGPVPPFWHIDQSRVNARMANHSTPHTLLDASSFPNGFMYYNYRKDLNDVVAFHANWNEKWEEKQGMLENMSLWYL